MDVNKKKKNKKTSFSYLEFDLIHNLYRRLYVCKCFNSHFMFQFFQWRDGARRIQNVFEFANVCFT